MNDLNGLSANDPVGVSVGVCFGSLSSTKLIRSLNAPGGISLLKSLSEPESSKSFSFARMANIRSSATIESRSKLGRRDRSVSDVDGSNKSSCVGVGIDSVGWLIPGSSSWISSAM